MQTRPVHILHIDDDAALVRLVERALTRRGFTVENAADIDAGLARIRAGGLDAVVLDHYLASGTGLTVLHAMRDLTDPPPVVYVTGSMEPALAVDALKAGAEDYVLKSAGEDFVTLLAKALEQAINAARMRQAHLRAEAEIRAAKDRAELLLAEVNHRVGNSLALVAALVRMQASAIADPGAKEALAETQVRISAIANLHRSLYTSDDVRNVALDDYLATIVAELGTSMSASGHKPLVKLDLDRYSIPTDKAVSVGMIVTELLTNALKYAYPTEEKGEVRLILRRSEDGAALLTVEDDGIGWNGTGVAKGTGLGSRIVKAMAANLGATITHGDGVGGTCTKLVLAES
ncbi:sensor histidine kinase [Tianweitania sediminis]|uniref:histidine kinase n=1 Tax=Tianweitania sediminis TaxID=1502156 RepID=A0A8J7QZN9_9HYPH|nr:response regulator [Tianweitania sediminis]